MVKVISVVLLLAVVGLGGAFVSGMAYGYSDNNLKEAQMYEFTMKNIDGQDVKLDKYKGKVVMFVNTASRCGLTPQYEGLQALYDKYKDRGFVVLGFPANNFMGQEPGTEKEIKEFCTLKYNVTFPMFSKISVKGADQHPLYAFLTNKAENPGFDGDITWNFEKFVADRSGKIVARFSPKTIPTDAQITKVVEAALGNAAAAN